MVRGWNEFVAGVDDTVGLGLVTLLLFVTAAVVGLGWYHWPAWWPRGGLRSRLRFHRPSLRWPRLRWPRLRWPGLRWPWRRRRSIPADHPDAGPGPHDTEGLPDLPAEAFRSLADRLAAEGRYAEAIRERLRGVVRELVDTGVVANHPGWTVTELATAAGCARPPVRPPLDAATRLFSDVWYGQRPATAEHDGQMRGYASHVHAALTPVPVGGPR